MPRLSQLMVRTALVWLIIGFGMGGLALWNKGLPFSSWVWTLRLAHVHALLIGWMVQLAFGVAFWIFPRLDASNNRGDESLVWLCYFVLNLGVALATLHDPLVGLVGPGGVWLLPVLAAGMYLLAMASFAAHAWPRVVSFRELPRPDR